MLCVGQSQTPIKRETKVRPPPLPLHCSFKYIRVIYYYYFFLLDND
jgi:hypothetical protein